MVCVVVGDAAVAVVSCPSCFVAVVVSFYHCCCEVCPCCSDGGGGGDDGSDVTASYICVKELVDKSHQHKDEEPIPPFLLPHP